MPPKGWRKPTCVNGHLRTEDTTDPPEKGSGCKLCRKAKNKAQRKNPHFKAYRAKWQRNWVKNNPKRALKVKLKTLYGITPEHYAEMLEKQNGKCAICEIVLGDDKVKGPNRPAIDHRHNEEKAVRGILCSNCNCGIGLLKDDPQVLLKAAKYLQAAA